MIDEVQVRNIVNNILKEEHLNDFIKIFEKEHNLFRGSHDKINLPEDLEIPEKIITQIIKHVSGTFKELEDTDIPEHLTGDFVQYDEGIEKWKRMAALTEGSILFADADGYFTEDNVNLAWNDTLKVLEVLAPDYNTYIGKSVIGAGNSSGDRNVFIGWEVGYENTIGLHNVFIGYKAGRVNTSGNFGTFVGYRAGYKHTIGMENTLVGYDTGYWLTSSQSNTCLGNSAGMNLTTGTGRNTLLGAHAGNWLTTGYENVSLGMYSGGYTTIGYRNTCLGYFSSVSEFEVHVDAHHRIAIGYGSLSKENNLCAIGGLLAADSVNLAIFYNREFRFYDDGDNYVGFKAPALGANQIWTLPTADAVHANSPLVSDASGILSWAGNVALGDDERGLTSIRTLSADPAKSDGIALYAEGHIGAITTDGPTYGAGAWLNIDPGAILGGDVRALDIGVYERGADCRGVNAYGLAIHMDFDLTNPPDAIYPFRLNCWSGGATPDALIFAPNKEALGLVTADPGTPDDAYLKIQLQDGSVYRIPLVKE